MAGRPRDALEAQLEHLYRLDRTHGTKPLDGVPPHPAIERVDLLVGQPRISLGDGHELATVPDAERVVGEEAGAAATAGLRVDQDRVDRERLDLPLPPVAAFS